MVTKRNKSSSSASRRSLAATREEKQHAQGLTMRKTTTETVVRRHSTAGGADTTLSEYEEDPWERSPKTDYTYSRSATYSRAHRTAGYISPNMSRRSVHGSSTSLVAPVPVLRLEDSPESDISSFTSVSQQHQSKMHAQRDVTPVRHPARQQTREPDSLSQEELDYIRLSGGVPPSTTRSGINYGMRYWWGRSHNRGSGGRRSLVTEDVTDSTLKDMQPMQKRLDYSAKPNPANETYLPDMYGLDNYSDESDTETTFTRTTDYSERSSVTQAVTQSVVSVFKYLYLAFITFIVTTCTISWKVLRFPYTLITSLLSKRQHGSLVKQSWLGMCHSLYRQVARLVIADTQLLSRTSGPRQRYGLCCMLPLILLLPLLLVGLFYAYSCGGMALLGVIPIPAFSSSSDTPITKEVPMTGCPSGCPSQMTDEQLTEKVQRIFMGLYREREEAATEKRTEEQKNIIFQQQTLMKNHMDGVETMIKTLVQKEYVTFAAGIASKEDTSNESNEAIRAVLAEQEQKIAAKLNQIQLQQDANIISTKDQLQALHDKINSVIVALAAARKDLESQNESVRTDGALLVAALEEKLAGLKEDMSRLEAAHLGLLAGVKGCCKNDSTLALMVKAAVQEQLAALAAAGSDEGGSTILGAAVGGGGKTEEFKEDSPFFLWLNDQQYVKQTDVDSRISALTSRLNEQIKQQSESAAAAAIAAAGVMGGSKDNTGGVGIAAATVDCSTCKGMFIMPNGTQLTEEQVRLLIKEALLIFGADKTGMVDYALESSGGSVLSIRCSETYHRRTAQISLFGIPLWYASNSPRTVIQPDVQPGQCWAFKGTQGYLVIQLAGNIQPTAFSLEHIPKALSPTGKIESAPKDFSVWGLEHEKDLDGVLFGNFTYRDDGEPLQSFPVLDPTVGAFNIVELRIHSNHGNLEYTCLYRFRVHGHLKRW